MKSRYLVIVVMLCLLASSAGCQKLMSSAAACTGQPTRQVAVTAQAAQSLSDKVDAANSQGQFRLQVTEQEVTSYLATRVSNTPVTQAVIWFTPQKAYLQGQVNMAGTHQVQVALSLDVNEGKLSIGLLCGSLDGKPMPAVALNTLQQALNATLSDYASPIRWESVQIIDGSLIAAGQRQ